MTITDEMVERALLAFRDAVNAMKECPKCEGIGYHHGFGEDGCSPDWCVECGGCQFIAAHTEEEAMTAALTAALGETHVVVPREPAAWLVGWHRANGEAGLTSYVNEDDARRAAKNLETYSASETMADVQPLYAVTSPNGGGST